MTRIWFFVLVFIFPALVDAQRLWTPQKPLFRKHDTALFDSDEDQTELLRERLPRVVNVSKYELTIFPHFPFLGLYRQHPDFTFDGTVKIYFTTTQKTQFIWLFAQNLLEFKSVKLTTSFGSIPLSYFSVDKNTTRVTLKTVTPLESGQDCTLSIVYRGPINEYGDAGLYYSKYMDSGGDIRYLVGTFFEPMRARKMFPGFDDPYFKATFQLSVTYPKKASIFSNVKDGAIHEYNELFYTKDFTETARMSTYLLAFVIGTFETGSATTLRGIPVQTIAIPELANYLPASAKIGANCIDAMESLVHVNYPLEKLDNVEMIEMGHSSAMENFGLIVYTRFLSQLQIATPAQNRFTQSMIMCHEISHQWFGDLVTASRWGYEFLHESFAAYFQNRAIQQFQADQNEYIENVMVWNKNSGMHSQSKTEHAVVADRAYFDDVTYAAGGAMLRMFERVLGTDDFFKALNSYLNKNQFGNADADTLIDEFVAVHNSKSLCDKLDVRQIFDDFLKNKHYPIVDVWIYNNKYQFSSYPSNPHSQANWTIPIFAYNLRTGRESVGYLLKDNTVCPENFVNATEPYIFNHKSTSFIRVRYSDDLWDQLLSMDTSAIDDSTLLGLITDEIDLEGSGYKPISNWRSIKLFKKIVADSKGKVAPHIVEAILSRFLSVRNFFSSGDSQDLYSHMLQTHFSSIYNQLDWTSSDWKTGHINNLLLPAAVKFNIGDARKKASDAFQQLTTDCASFKDLENCNRIQADARTAVYCAGAMDNKNDTFDFLRNYWYEMIRKRHTYFYFQYEMQAVVNGLACITDADKLTELLDTAVREEETGFIDALAYNSNAAQVIYDYISANVARFNKHLPLLENALEAMISTWYTSNDKDKLLTLIATIHSQFPDDEGKLFSKVIMDLQSNIDRANLAIPQYSRWMFDDTVPIGKPAWTKELTGLDIKNINYQLSFTPYYPNADYFIDAAKFYTYDGHAFVTFTTNQFTQQFQINSHRQLISFIAVSTNHGQIDVQTQRDYENGILTLNLATQVAAGTRVTIEFTYLGFIFNRHEDSTAGIVVYQTYNAKIDEETPILSTQFAGGANARSLIPCFDEPKYKATWDISVTHPAVFTALSNGAIKDQQQLDNGYMTTTFTQTKRMSSYLVALALGKFGSLSGLTASGVPVRVWARLGYELYTRTALQAAIGTIDYLSKELGEDYKKFNSKLDILAAPLYPGLEAKQQVFTVMSHETVHHWFGDLVTTKDWYTTFVSEGFATFFEAVIYEHFFNGGEKFRFVASEQALRYDEQNKDRIIPSDVNADGFQPFAPIVYLKPSSVLHTLRSVVGNDVFMQGLRGYINGRAFANADDITLWNYIQQAANAQNIAGWDDNKLLDVQRFMDPFFKQASYPILSVTASKDGLVHVSQSSYYDPQSLPKSDYNYRWYVPVTWVFDAIQNYTDWSYNDILEQIPLESAAWLTLGRETYARVKYDDIVWTQILGKLKNNSNYNEAIWAAAITDTYSLVNTGQLKWDRMLELLQHLKYTDGELPWKYGFEIFDELIGRLKMTPDFKKLKSLISDVINSRGTYDQYDDWKFKDANNIIIKLASRLNIGKFVDIANTYMTKFGQQCIASPFGVHQCLQAQLMPDNRSPFLCSGIQSNKNLKDNLETILLNLNEEKNAFLTASVDPLIETAACLQDEKEVQKYLVNIVVHEYYNFGEEFIQRLSKLDTSGKFLYNWLQESTKGVSNLAYVHQSKYFNVYVQAMTENWATLELLQTFNDINWPVLTNAQADAVQKAADTIQANIDWQAKNFDTVSKWLNKNY